MGKSLSASTKFLPNLIPNAPIYLVTFKRWWQRNNLHDLFLTTKVYPIKTWIGFHLICSVNKDIFLAATAGSGWPRALQEISHWKRRLSRGKRRGKCFYKTLWKNVVVHGGCKNPNSTGQAISATAQAHRAPKVDFPLTNRTGKRFPPLPIKK